ncbi:MAG: S1 RNA-binding domain-containing protein [Candidatus Peregrinibacteria bacterium]|nr:S1 RNA-binding domain-containing protein [Candidatus Peregrinibacteria bacterium]MDZ4244749.1 S1 RNA-binding domain-containing protein [Candidatus Gracilibacteria bacterium]
MAATKQAPHAMDELLKDFSPFKVVPGELIEGAVISIQKNCILVDLNGTLTGSISGKESKDAFDTAKGLKPGDTVIAAVLEEENEEGFVVLSFRKASQEKTWKKFIDAYSKDEAIKVKPTEANKGGLLLDLDGIKGFIPVSQLSPLHYPRVNGADANQILTKLKELMGVELEVKILNLDKENGKLILSEKAAFQGDRSDTLDKLAIGQKIKGRISGIVAFGIFVTFGQVEGLVHVSEIEWGHCKDTRNYGKVGEEVEVMVIGIENGKISLSMKRLTSNPWENIEKDFPLGQKVTAVVNKVTPFGVFVALNDQINGLIHISELYEDAGDSRDPITVFKAGEKIEAWVIAVDQNEHRIALSVREETAKKAISGEVEALAVVKVEEEAAA